MNNKKFSEFRSALDPVIWVWSTSVTFWSHRASSSKVLGDADKLACRYSRNIFGTILVYGIIRDAIKFNSLFNQKTRE